jgi:tricarballylate dehydrogenase
VVIRGADCLLQTVSGRHVLLACGGFEGNAEMLTQYVGPTAVDLVPIAPGIKFNTGDGIRMAQEMGAGTAGQFDMIHAEGVDSRSSKADAVVWSYMFGIVVNQAGQRFFDEGANVLDRTFELLGNEIWRNQNQQAFLIADRKYLDVPGVEFLNVTDLPPIQADTIEELAKLLSVDADGLAATIAEYNDATQDGVFDPSILDGLATQGIAPPKSNWAQRIDEGPFVAYPLTGAVTFTFGGLRVNADGHVLTQAGRVIPHLFAAGEITGLYYHEYACATSVLRSLTFGRRVGQLVGTALPASAAIA